MKVFTGFAELLFVGCAQSAPPRARHAGVPQGKARNREPLEKILVAVATTVCLSQSLSLLLSLCFSLSPIPDFW
jgi:hypothetical protein